MVYGTGWFFSLKRVELSLTVQVCGKREREVDLVIPGCYNARTSRKKIADILSTEIKEIKERYPHFELEIEQDATSTPVLMQNLFSFLVVPPRKKRWL